MYFLAYLKFLFLATNQHGVHSPFVYAFVTKCIYNKDNYSKKKGNNIVLKIIAYFKIVELNLQDKNKNLELEIAHHFPETGYNYDANDFIYFDNLNNNTDNYIEDNKKIHNETIVFINNIYKQKKTWNSLIDKDKITVSIDLFYVGILFFRREQVKEHFKIRI